MQSVSRGETLMLKNLAENWQVKWGSGTDVAFVCQGETRC